jgi:predicted TIM-barrel fold metal-dependent hydrolase
MPQVQRSNTFTQPTKKTTPCGCNHGRSKKTHYVINDQNIQSALTRDLQVLSHIGVRFEIYTKRQLGDEIEKKKIHPEDLIVVVHLFRGNSSIKKNDHDKAIKELKEMGFLKTSGISIELHNHSHEKTLCEIKKLILPKQAAEVAA